MLKQVDGSKALKKAGISLDDVKIKFYKEFDVYGTWDPYLAIVENKVKTRTIINGTDLTENRTFYFATEKLLKEKPEVVTTILEELEKADQWANENKKEVAKILSTELGLEVAPLQKANDRRTFGVKKIDKKIISSQQELANTFYEAKLLDSKINIKEAVKIDDAMIPSNIQ